MSVESPGPVDADGLFQYLGVLGIVTTTVTHPPLYTVEDSKALRGDLPGGHCKNLFLRNKKGHMWLVVCPEDRVLDLKDLGDRIGAGRVSFGSPERLMTYLGVLPGAVTPFAVMNDTERRVSVVLDQALTSESLLNFHPLVNDQTATIAPADLMKFLEAVDHRPAVMALA
jgi:Ala-tRNA(Pro) deacylase